MEMDHMTWNGYTAPKTTWRALGASSWAQRVEFQRRLTSDDTPTESYVLELLIRARAELPFAATDAAIVERAVVLRAQDRSTTAIRGLAEALARISSQPVDVRVRGAVLHAALEGE